MRNIIHENSAIGIRLKKFGLALDASPPLLNREKQLIFLCGANQAANKPSARRATLKKFIQQLSSAYTVLYAEGIFNELIKFGNQKNILDLEHKISEIADKIIIILESESAFCELGAFAHASLRKKLIIINNSQFKTSESFINLGPIAAAEEVKSPVIWYPMKKDGVTVLDGIGAVFQAVKNALIHKQAHGTPVKYEALSNLGMNKLCLYFIHDLVVLAAPVSHEEIVALLKFIFGNKSFDLLRHLLGVLRESQLINVRQVQSTRFYTTASTDFFLKYRHDLYPLMAAFRAHHLKFNPERFQYD